MNTLDREESSTSTAFILWLSCLFGFCGIHRFYLGKPLSGFLYLVTFGVLGIGQLLDLFWMRRLVAEANGHLLPAAPSRRLLPPPPTVDAREVMRVKLLQAAASHEGALSVSQGVLATGRPFAEVEKALDEMAVSGYVGIDNDPQTGAVVYTFDQLQR